MKVKLEFEVSWRKMLEPARWVRLIVAVAILAGLLAGHPHLPDAVIGLYAMAAILFGFESSWSFIFALILLVAIPLMNLLGQTVLAQDYAVYAFYFLVLGVAGSLFELRPEESKHPEPVIPNVRQRQATIGQELSRRPGRNERN